MTPGVPELIVDVNDENMTRIEADCAVVAIFDDQRPLRGGAGVVDWRLCGRLSALLGREPLTEWVLLPSEGRLATPRILVGSLGDSKGLDAPRLGAFAAEAARRLLQLQVDRLVWDLGFCAASVSADGAAAAVLSGFRDILSTARCGLHLQFCVPPEEGLRWRVAVERAVARQPRGSAPLDVRSARQPGTARMATPVERPAIAGAVSGSGPARKAPPRRP